MKLKPCPFCKSENLGTAEIPVVVVSQNGTHEKRLRDLAITCDDCDAYGPSSTRLEDAAYLWNARKSTAK